MSNLTELRSSYFGATKKLTKTLKCTSETSLSKLPKLFSNHNLLNTGLPLSSLRRIEEIWGGITNIFEEICQNLAQNLRRIEEISHIYVLVDLTFTDVMSSNITVCSRRNTTLIVSKKWTFNMKLCNLYYIILTIWTHIICTWTNFLSHQYLQVYRIKNTL